jgi:hypothetical protein
MEQIPVRSIREFMRRENFVTRREMRLKVSYFDWLFWFFFFSYASTARSRKPAYKHELPSFERNLQVTPWAQRDH